MIELPTGERMRVKDVRDTNGAAELIASSQQTYVGDNHISRLLYNGVFCDSRLQMQSNDSLIPLTPAPLEPKPSPSEATCWIQRSEHDRVASPSSL